MSASRPTAPDDTVVDPVAATQALGAPLPPVSIGPPSAPIATVSRRVAAEIGMYVGALLILLALGSAVVRGWVDWQSSVRAATVTLAALALLTAGLWARVGAARALSPQRRRAVSGMLTSGSAIGLVGLAVATAPATGAPGALTVTTAGLAVLAGVGSVAGARSPLSETWLLACLAWAAWLLVPRGPAVWALLTALGAGWALAACGPWRVRGRTLLPERGLHRGRRTAFVVGSSLALLGGVALASGSWAWPARGVLLIATVGAFSMIGRGGANQWVALGAACGAALVAAMAGDVLGPALALLLGGVATMALSWLALRSAPEEPGGAGTVVPP